MFTVLTIEVYDYVHTFSYHLENPEARYKWSSEFHLQTQCSESLEVNKYLRNECKKTFICNVFIWFRQNKFVDNNKVDFQILFWNHLNIQSTLLLNFYFKIWHIMYVPGIFIEYISLLYFQQMISHEKLILSHCFNVKYYTFLFISIPFSQLHTYKCSELTWLKEIVIKA